jgi:hypothetical protein
MRVLFRIILALLIALPVILGWMLFVGLQTVIAAAPSPGGEEPLSSAREGLGQKRGPA